MWSWLSTWAWHGLILIWCILHHQMTQTLLFSSSRVPCGPWISHILLPKRSFCLLQFPLCRGWIVSLSRFFLKYTGISLWCLLLATQTPHLWEFLIMMPLMYSSCFRSWDGVCQEYLPLKTEQLKAEALRKTPLLRNRSNFAFTWKKKIDEGSANPSVCARSSKKPSLITQPWNG